MVSTVDAGQSTPACADTNVSRSMSENVAGGAVVMLTWFASPLTAAPTPYSLLIADQ
jgi:hypothetical protein